MLHYLYKKFVYPFEPTWIERGYRETKHWFDQRRATRSENRVALAFSVIPNGPEEFSRKLVKLKGSELDRLKYLIDSKIKNYGTVMSEQDTILLLQLRNAQEYLKNFSLSQGRE